MTGRALLLAACLIACAHAAPGQPLSPPYLVLQRELFQEGAIKPYGVTLCAAPYGALTGQADPATTTAVETSQFQDPATGATQVTSRTHQFVAEGDWASSVASAITAAAPYQGQVLSVGGCPVAATVRTFLIAVQQANGQGVTVLAVRCQATDGTVTGAAISGGVYLSQLMRGAVPTCAAIDAADFSTLPLP